MMDRHYGHDDPILLNGGLSIYTVPQLLRERAKRSPHRLALSAMSAGGARDRLTYAQLVHRMEAAARGMAALGIAPKDRFAVFLDNNAGRECVLSALGALALGAVVVPMNTRSSQEDLRHVFDLVRPVAVATDRAGAERLAGLASEARLLVVDGEGEAGREYAALLEPGPHGARSQPAEPTDPDALGCLLFTSGTTARPKAVMHSHRTMIATGRCSGEALDISEADLYQGAFPFFTSSALNLACMSSWVRGAGFVMEGVLDNASRLNLIASEGTTFYHGVPSILNFMLQEFERADYDLKCLRRVAYGGAAMPPEIAARIGKAWPWLDQVQIYGSTESGPSGTILLPGEMERKVGSVGRAMPHCRVEVLGDGGEVLDAGEIGEIAISGPAVAVGYYRDKPATDAAFSGRRLRTGDVGYMDEGGFVFFTDRKKDIINRGGLKISSIAVESVLYRHGAVGEAAVVAIPHAELGEDVAACLVLRPGTEVTTAELVAFCRDKLADYAVPRRWLFLEELPKNPMGKVLKAELRKQAAEAASG